MSTYACSDLHGNKALYDLVMSYIQPEDTLIYLGDIIDRGEHGYEMLKDILHRDNVVFLKGNHEDMFIRAAKEMREVDNSDFLAAIGYKQDSDLWFYNGGYPTYKAWTEDGKPWGIIEALERCETSYYHESLKKRSDGYRQWVLCTHSGNPNEPLWDREHFKTEDKWLLRCKEIYVHGHTPIPLQLGEKAEFQLKPYFYNKGFKVNIDCCSYISNATVLLNLDTFEYIPIIATKATDN